MWLKRYLSLSKVESFIFIIVLIFVALLVFGVNVNDNSVSVFSLKVPLQVRGTVSDALWSNFHYIFVFFSFFSYLILAVEDKESDLLRPFAFLIFVYLLFSVFFGFKFGFSPFGRSFISLISLLFTIYSFLFFFETVVNSRGIGAIFLIVVSAFSGLIIYLYNFRDILFSGFYSSLIEAKYYSLPIFQKYSINFDFKNDITPALLFFAALFFRSFLKKRGENE